MSSSAPHHHTLHQSDPAHSAAENNDNNHSFPNYSLNVNTSGNDGSITTYSAFPQDGAYRSFAPLQSPPQDTLVSHNWNHIQYMPPDAHNPYVPSWSQSSQHPHHRRLQPNGASETTLGNDANFFQRYDQPSLAFQNGRFNQTDAYSGYNYPHFDPRVAQQALPGFDVQPTSYGAGSGSAATIAPEALQSRQIPSNSPPAVLPQTNIAADVPSGESAIPQMPAGEASGRFLVTSLEKLQEATNAKRLRSFLGVGAEPVNLQITKSTIPVYLPRKSRNEIRRLLANDKDLATKVTKKAGKPVAGVAATPKKLEKPETSALQAVPRVKREASASSTDISSSDEESSSDSEEEDTKPPLPVKRPETAVDAVKYDTTKALWRSPRYLALDRDDIANGISAFWEIVRTIRDRWKLDTTAVKQAEEAKQLNELPLLKERVSMQRNMIAVALRTALELGHAGIVENFGGHLQFMQSLAQFMQDRAVNSDYSGDFTHVILQLLSRCVTLTEGALEKTSVGKLLPRFAKRGDDKIKSLAKRIQDNAVAASKKRKQDAAKPSTSQTDSTTKSSVDGTLRSTTTAGVKRPLVGESGSPQPQKKVAANQNSITSPSKSTPNPLSAASLGNKSINPAAAPPKSKVQPVVAKPSGFFSSLQSAKKSSTSNSTNAAGQTSKPAATDKPAKQSVTTSTTSHAQPKSSTSSSSFFASTMASLTKPKEVEPAEKQEDIKPPETEEEKAKRLRKEERKKLRVSFKPESTLVEVRYFTHDPEEELGHDASQVLDADDVKSEGQMFKKHHNDDLMDIDDDDEEYSPEDMEDVVKEFREPSLIDFSVIDHEERERLYEPYGGGLLKPECPEKTVQEEREASTLMAIYSNSEDVPATPQEPSAENSEEEAQPPKEFGEPPQFFMARMKSVQEEPTSEHNQLSAYNLAAGFGTLTQTSQEPQEQKSGSSSLTELEKIFAQFAGQGQQQPTVQPPVTQSQPAQPQSGQAPNMSAIFAALSGAQQNQAEHQNHGYGQQANQYQQPTPTTSNGPDLSAILASLSAGNMQAPQAPQMQSQGSNQSHEQNPWYSQQHYDQANQGSYMQPPAAQQQTGISGGYPYENEERRRMREAGDTDMYDERPSNPAYGGNKKGGASGKGWGNNNKGGGSQGKEKIANKPTPFKVVACKYWKEGKCRKGSECTFLHQ